MARRERPAREKPQIDQQQQKQTRRMQVVLVILSFFLILSLVLSAITF